MRTLLVKLFVKLYVFLLFIRTLLIKPSLVFSFLDYFTKKFPIETVSPPSAFEGVTVCVPFRDKWDMTLDTLRSIGFGERLPFECEIILIDNGSVEKKTSSGIKKLISTNNNVRLIVVNEEFNFSRLMNIAVENSKFDLCILLNNDVAFHQGNFEEFSHRAMALKETGCLGSLGMTLFYANGLLQHLFLAPGVKLGGAHPGAGYKISEHSWFSGTRVVPAVTGAVMAVSKDIFQKVGGFDESLKTAYQDVDYCIRASECGFKNYVASDLSAIHLESATRRKNNPKNQLAIFRQKHESEWMTDFMYPSELSRWSQRPLLRWLEKEYPLDN